jgi:hypothetical protein
VNLFLPRFFDGPGHVRFPRSIDSHPWAFTTYLGVGRSPGRRGGPRRPRSAVLWGRSRWGVLFARESTTSS